MSSPLRLSTYAWASLFLADIHIDLAVLDGGVDLERAVLEPHHDCPLIVVRLGNGVFPGKRWLQAEVLSSLSKIATATSPFRSNVFASVPSSSFGM